MAKKKSNYDTERVFELLDKVRNRVEQYDRYVQQFEGKFNYEAFDNLSVEVKQNLIKEAEKKVGIKRDKETMGHLIDKFPQELQAPKRSKIASKNRIMF